MPPTARWMSWLVNDVVIDSSVAVAWMLADEPLHEAARRFRATLEAGERGPIVAEHFGFEVRHALIRAARRERIAWLEVGEGFAALDAFEPTVVPLRRRDDPILDLAHQFGLTWGDAHWVDVAMRLDLPLVTADLRLARSIPDEVAIVAYLGDDQAA
jgi:predicted nucleic acid-binding protein